MRPHCCCFSYCRKKTTLKAPERAGKRLPGPVQLILTIHKGVRWGQGNLVHAILSTVSVQVKQDYAEPASKKVAVLITV
jgi:hypothetical protein